MILTMIISIFVLHDSQIVVHWGYVKKWAMQLHFLIAPVQLHCENPKNFVIGKKLEKNQMLIFGDG